MKQYIVTERQIAEVVGQAAGLGAGAVMALAPDVEMPSEVISAGVDELLAEHTARFVDLASPQISRNEVEAFLDTAIRHWRNVRDGKIDVNDKSLIPLSPSYVDCLQSARTSLLGEPLPTDDGSEIVQVHPGADASAIQA